MIWSKLKVQMLFNFLH